MIEVAFDGPGSLTAFTRIFLEPDMSLNRFRRACSQKFGADIISIFLTNGEKATDTSEIRRHRRVVASPHFNLRNPVDIDMRESKLSYAVTGSRASTALPNPPRFVYAVEIASHPGSGKTTFIQSFVHETLKKERNQVIEAVYKKSLDVDSAVCELVITDTTEGPGDEPLRPMKEKQAVLFMLSKERLTEKAPGGDFSVVRGRLMDKMAECRKQSKGIYVGLVVSKCDLMSEYEGQIDAFLAEMGKSFDVFKVSTRDDALGTDLKNPAQVFTEVARQLVARSLSQHKDSTTPTTVSSGVPFPTTVTPAPRWIDSLTRIFSCGPRPI